MESIMINHKALEVLNSSTVIPSSDIEGLTGRRCIAENSDKNDNKIYTEFREARLYDSITVSGTFYYKGARFMRGERYFRSRFGWKQTMRFTVFDSNDNVVAKLSIDCDSSDDPQSLMSDRARDIYGSEVHV